MVNEENSAYGNWVAIHQSGGASTAPEPIAFVIGPKYVTAGDGISTGFSPSHANLIASAPDLLEALKLAKDHSELSDEILDIVDDAIAKTEGRS